MLVIRPVGLADLDRLYELAEGAGHGLTSLPHDRELLHGRIIESIESFARLGHKPRGDSFLFVLEDLDAQRPVGTTGIVSKVGGFEPFYAYKIETAVHESAALKVRKEIKFLRLVTEHNGPCEIGSLFLDPDYRKEGNGRLLSLSRFLFLAEHPRRFDPTVIAELRGVVDDSGHSAFWEALGRHFFDIDYTNADRLSGVDKRFIADLMPRHPIYIPLLTPEAQAVIGKIHPRSEAACEILREEGFRDAGMVDIFDAGPVVTCPREEIRAVRESRKATVQEIVGEFSPEELANHEPFIIAAAREDFRACKGCLHVLPDGVRLQAPEATALRVGVGDAVRFVTLKPRPTHAGEIKSV